MAATAGTPKGGNPTTDPLIAFNFMLEIAGIITAGFHDCSGLDSTIDVVEHREGARTPPSRSSPARPSSATSS